MNDAFAIYINGIGYYTGSKRIQTKFSKNASRARLFSKEGYARNSIRMNFFNNAFVVPIKIEVDDKTLVKGKLANKELSDITQVYNSKKMHEHFERMRQIREENMKKEMEIYAQLL